MHTGVIHGGTLKTENGTGFHLTKAEGYSQEKNRSVQQDALTRALKSRASYAFPKTVMHDVRHQE